MFLISSCSCLCAIYWSQVLSQEWRCSWSSADRQCSNYIWVINNFIAYGASYIKELRVSWNIGIACTFKTHGFTSDWHIQTFFVAWLSKFWIFLASLFHLPAVTQDDDFQQHLLSRWHFDYLLGNFRSERQMKENIKQLSNIYNVYHINRNDKNKAPKIIFLT